MVRETNTLIKLLFIICLYLPYKGFLLEECSTCERFVLKEKCPLCSYYRCIDHDELFGWNGNKNEICDIYVIGCYQCYYFDQAVSEPELTDYDSISSISLNSND